MSKISVKEAAHLFVLLIVVLFSSCEENTPKVKFNEIMCNNLNYATDEIYFNYSDWIELKNITDDLLDISGYTINDSRNSNGWKIPDGTILSAGGYQLFWADGKDNRNHTNFKLKNSGESLYLYNTEGLIVDSIKPNNQIVDVSYGYSSKGKLGYFNSPTPNAENSSTVIVKPNIQVPVIDEGPQLVQSGYQIKLMKPTNNLTIRYTLDCSNPNASSKEYQAPIQIDNTTIIRAICIDQNGLASDIITKSYIIRKPTNVPILSLVTDSRNLWDDHIGIYTVGKNGSAGQIGPVANWNRDWERPANVEFFEKSDTVKVNEQAGIKILGLYISAWPQKPFGIYFRKKYGKSKVNYPFFPEKEANEYSHLIIRVADWNDTGIRDGLMTNIVAETTEIDCQGYRPVATYINGEFWGIYNLREKQNENYLMLNHGVDPNKVDLIEYKIGKINVIEGSGDDFRQMMEFCQNNSLVDPDNYKAIAEQIDLDNYLDYYIAELYFANSDWPGNNLKCWKSQREGSKWRWILYDLDTGFDFLHAGYAKFNSLNHALTIKGDAHHNPPHSTLLFRSLMMNKEFVQKFLQRYAVHLNTTLATNRVKSIVEKTANDIQQLIPEQAKKWEKSPILPGGYSFYKTPEKWQKNVDLLKDFADERNPYIWQMLMASFQITETVNISLGTTVGGFCSLAGVELNKKYSGKHFKNVPVVVKAITKEGYEFVGWKGDTRKEASIQIVPSQNISLAPIFRKIS